MQDRRPIVVATLPKPRDGSRTRTTVKSEEPLNNQINAQHLAAQHPRPGGHPSPTTSLFRTTCLRLHNATHITQHSKEKSNKGRNSE
jgi:hypothetical protein